MRAGGTRRRLVAILALMILAIAVLPLIVAKSPLRNSLIAMALPDGQLQVEVGDASLGWFSGPSLAQVVVRDADGQLLLTAENIALDRSPGSLFLNPRQMGTIAIVRPTLYVAIRPDGSNVEDVINAFSNKSGVQPPLQTGELAPPVAFRVHVQEGTVVAEDLAMSRKWRIEGVDLQADTHGANGGLGRGQLVAQIVAVPAREAARARPGRIAASFGSDAAGRQQLSWQAENFSLALVEPWLRRAVVAGELNGLLSSQGTANWTKGAAAMPSDLVTAGTLAIDQLDASAPLLQGDRLRLVRMEMPWRLSPQADGWRIEDLQLRSDIGMLAMRGTIEAAAFSRAPAAAAAVTSPASRHAVELRGSIDVARLAELLPHALRIRQDTTIRSGLVEFAGRCQPSGSGQIVTCSLNSDELIAVNAGQIVRWDRPVSASIALQREPAATQIQSLTCTSDFLQATASGTPQQFKARASFDLNRLAEQLGQFIDLRHADLAGTGDAELTWANSANQAFRLDTAGQLSSLRVTLADGTVWAEPQLQIKASATGALDAVSQRPSRVDSARLTLSAQDDQLTAELTSGAALANVQPVWPVALQAKGRLAHWLTRVRPWVSLRNWQADGECDLVANALIGAGGIEARDVQLTVADLQATGAGWNINESRVELVGDMRWHGATRELATTSARFVTSTVSLAVKEVKFRSGQALDGAGAAPLHNAASLEGTAAFRADLARLAMLRASTTPPAYRPQGEVTGNVRFVQQNGRVTGNLTARGANLALAQPTPTGQLNVIWQEPSALVRGIAAYEPAADRLEFSQLQIESNTVQASADGQIQNLSGAADATINGTANYDLAQVTPLLKPYIGNGIELRGRERARFLLAGQIAESMSTPLQAVSFSKPSPAVGAGGSHWSRRVRAQLELPWSGASVYGLPVGAGHLLANIGDGAVRIEPLTLAVGEGQLTASPYVRLDPNPAELTLPAGRLITNVRISPQVSETMLKYVAPVLSGATQSEGQFSLELDGTRVPLGEPKRTDTGGRLTVHAVRVVPGPLATQWISLAQQIESLVRRRDPAAAANRAPVTLLSIRDQLVRFRLTEGRVHHENMEFQVGDILMRSQGSVGLDETIALTLHVPVQDSWIAREPLLAGFKGQTLQVPIAGTLTRPHMDQRAIASVSQQLLQGAAQQAIGGEINKALDKLFKSR